MASTVDKVQARLQEAMEQRNQASLGQAIDASKGVNGLKQLRRSAKARLKQLSADQNRNMLGGVSHMPPEEPLTWRTSEQGGRYRAVAHLPTSIIGWVIGHKGCNARMLKQQTGTELWVDVPGQCVIIEARAVVDVEGGMEAVNGFVKTAPTFIAKAQAGGGGGITQTVQCPVHLLPSIQRLSRKIQAESGANCVFANCKMSTFCVTGDRRNVEAAVSMLKRLIMEGNSEVQANNNVNGHNANGLPGNINGNINGHINGNINGIINGNNNGDRRGGPVGIRGSAPGPGDVGQRMGRIGSDVMVSRNEKSPRTAPCSPEPASTANAWGNGAPSQLRMWNVHQPESQALPLPPAPGQQQQISTAPPAALCSVNATTSAPPATSLSSTLTSASAQPVGAMPPGKQQGGQALPRPLPLSLPPPPSSSSSSLQQQHGSHVHSHCPVNAPATPGGTAAPFQGANSSTNGGGGGPSSDLSFFSFGVGGVRVSPPVPGGAPAARASTAPTPCVSGGGSGGGAAGPSGGGFILPGLGFLEESAGAGGMLGYEHEYIDDERRASSSGSGEFGGGEAHSFPQHSRQQGSVGSLGVGSGSGGGGAGVAGGGGGNGCPLEGNIEDLLEELGLGKYLPVFQSAEVDLATLCIMSEQDFRELGILKGPRVKIMHHIGSR